MLRYSRKGQRASVRYKCGPATAGRVRLEGQEWQRAWVLNLSLDGAGLLLSRPLTAGLDITIVLLSQQNQSFEMPARICHATEQPDGDWIVGCEFIKQLTDEELEAVLQ